MIDWKQVEEYAKNGSPKPPKRVEKSAEEWKQELTDEEFQVARKHGTERAGTGEYCEAQEPGLYACVCCGTELFDSSEKFGSGSGWPSFTEAVQDNVIRYENDRSLMMNRVEVLCSVVMRIWGMFFLTDPNLPDCAIV